MGEGRIDSKRLAARLGTRRVGRVVYSFDEVGSTNDVALELGRWGAAEGTVVMADSQTKGRGRYGRRWVSPPGVNLYLSVVLRPAVEPGHAALATFVASLALGDTMRTVGVEPAIKWPNDMVTGGRKVAGVLTEAETAAARVEFLVVGIGLNVNMDGAAIERLLGEEASGVTSLREAAGMELDREEVAAALLEALDARYAEFLGRGAGWVVEAWNAASRMVGRRASVRVEGGVVEGVVRGVDAQGRLIVERGDGGVEAVVAGDVQVEW